jgi:hypothetical protein
MINNKNLFEEIKRSLIINKGKINEDKVKEIYDKHIDMFCSFNEFKAHVKLIKSYLKDKIKE